MDSPGHIKRGSVTRGIPFESCGAADPRPNVPPVTEFLDGLAKLAYESSAHALATQERRLDEVRERTGTLLAASALVASFLGSRALDTSGINVLGVLAMAAFGLSLIFSVFVLLPIGRLVFVVSGSALLEAEYSQQGGLGETHRKLAYWLDHDDNEPVIDRLFTWYSLAIWGTLAEVMLWAADIATA
jgi:hypothetical protein